MAEQPKSADDTGTPWTRWYPDGVEWQKTYAPTNVADVFDNAAAKFPDCIATNFLGKKTSYAKLAEQVKHAARGLEALGIKKGSHVGLFLPNSPTFIVFYYAALKLGATVVNFNPLYSHEELIYQVKDSQTDLMVTLDLKILFSKVEKLLEDGTLARAIVCSFPALLPGPKSALFRVFKGGELAKIKKSPVLGKLVLEQELLANQGDFRPAQIDPYEDIAVLQYTGGTTGTPKGAMLTHANVSINVQQVLDWSPDLKDGEERVFAVLPFFHVFAMTVVMNFGVARAAEIVIMPRFVLDDALKTITKTKPTVMPGVPTLFNAIINHQNLAKFDLTSLKYCLSGGAALPLEVKTRFEGLVEGCKLVEGYGLSETSPVLTANPFVGPVKENSIGLPLAATHISLRDINDPEREVPHGEEGEICAAGPQVMKGYWQKPDETANAFVGDYFRTGDVAIMDEDGFFYIVDRIKDLIIASGFNIYPRRIEEALFEHPAVDEVTVIGIPDAYRGEAPKAFIKLIKDATVTSDELMEYLGEKISKLELPAEIEFRDELPKTMIGKLSKKELKEEEAKRRQRTG